MNTAYNKFDQEDIVNKNKNNNKNKINIILISNIINNIAVFIIFYIMYLFICKYE